MDDKEKTAPAPAAGPEDEKTEQTPAPPLIFPGVGGAQADTFGPEDGAEGEGDGSSEDTEDAETGPDPEDYDGDDEDDDAPPPPPDPRRERLRWILAAAVTGLLILAAVAVFFNRDRLSEEAIRSAFGQQQPLWRQDAAFTYEIGSGQVFARAGNGLAVASSGTVELMGAEGETLYKQVVSFTSPAVFAADDRALYCDLGGTGAILADGTGERVTLTPGGNILSGSMNENGWCTLVTEAMGYKALVSVYDPAGREKYEWWSGAGYVLRSAVSPDNRTLAVICAENGGGRLHLFRLDSETEAASAWFEGELPYDLRFMGSDTLALVSDAAVRFVAADGTERGAYALGDSYLLDYELGSPYFAAVYVGSYRGSGGTLVTLDREGRVLGAREIGGDLVCLSACGRQLLTLTADGVVIYGQDLTRQFVREGLTTAKKAVLCADRHYLLLSSYAADRQSY